MEPQLNTLLAIKAGPFERHYTTCKGHRLRFWKIYENSISRSNDFIYGQVFRPSNNLLESDVTLLNQKLTVGTSIQFCGTFRLITLSQYFFDREIEVYNEFYLSEFYVVHPFSYHERHISVDQWKKERSAWRWLENFPDLKDQIFIHHRLLFRILFSVSLMDNPLKKIS